jgi:hypothetical protein
MTQRFRNFAVLALILLSVLAVPDSLAAKTKPKLTMEKAREIATAKEAGKVSSGEVEKEHGRLIYSFDIQRDNQTHEVKVDANTGEIVKDSVEDPAAEQREQQEEAAKKAKPAKGSPQS